MKLKTTFLLPRGGLLTKLNFLRNRILFLLAGMFSFTQVFAQPNCADVMGPAQVCIGAGNQVYSQSTCLPSTYQWSLTNTGTNASIVGSTTDATVVINPGTQTGTYTVMLVATSIGPNTVATGSRSTAVTGVTLGLTKQDVSCFGGNNGSVTATFSAGFPPYEVRINGGTYTVQSSPYTFTNLTAGAYTIDVRDSRGCVGTSQITVGGPLTAITAGDGHTNVTCNGGNNGSVTITFSGGTGPYQVNFNNTGFAPATSPAVYNNLTAGTYSWVVRDANNCTASGSETVEQPAGITSGDAHTNVSCNGGNNGSVTITFSGGTGPYQVNFNNTGFAPATSPAVYNNLTAGTYSWVVRDANNCTASGSETVEQPAGITSGDAHTNVSCNGGNNGSVTVTFSGGTGPYMVNFNNTGFAPATSPAVYNNLTAGTYSWVVRDANNCTASGSETVEQPAAITAGDGHTNVTCNGGNNGSVTVTFSGGTGPYQVNFNNTGFAPATSPAVYNNLTAGTYSWVVRDANNCTASGSETVEQPAAITAGDGHTNVTCNGGNNGSVTITFSGGTGPYQVNFNNTGFAPATSPAVYNNLTAGTYSWVVRDANNCTTSGSETVEQPAAITAGDGHTNVTCNGGNNGSVTVTFSGGTGPYMVNFNNTGFAPATSPAVYNNLTAGTYSWVVRDANNCTASGSETVEQPAGITSGDAHTNVSCNGGNNGSVTVTFSGGTGPYQVNFNNTGFAPATSPAVYNNLTAGTYSWVVRDANNCTASGSETVEQPAAITAGDDHTNVTCSGGNNGSVTVTFSGGTGPYMVNFNNTGFAPATSPAVYNNLTAGTYSWVVRDANNCTASGSETVEQPAAINLGLTQMNVPCENPMGGSVTATFSGGTGPYMVRIDGGLYTAQTSPYTFTGLAAGVHTVDVRDANMCTATMTITVGTDPCQGCSPGFWKNHTELWDNLGDYPPSHMPGGLQFITTTNFFTYFGIAPGSNGFPNNMTMLGAISQGGGNCKAFARHAVAALLSSASGLDIAYPTGTTDFNSLYTAIRNALLSGNCGGTLFTQLEAISEADHSMCGVFERPDSRRRLHEILTVSSEELNVKAYPNPYENNMFNLTINSPVNGEATIQLFTMDGNKISELKRNVAKGKDQAIGITVPLLQKTRLVYVVSIGNYNAKGIVLSPN